MEQTTTLMDRVREVEELRKRGKKIDVETVERWIQIEIDYCHGMIRGIDDDTHAGRMVRQSYATVLGRLAMLKDLMGSLGS